MTARLHVGTLCGSTYELLRPAGIVESAYLQLLASGEGRCEPLLQGRLVACGPILRKVQLVLQLPHLLEPVEQPAGTQCSAFHALTV